jgi:hypothetical protein
MRQARGGALAQIILSALASVLRAHHSRLRLENQRPPAAVVPITPLLDLVRAHVRSVAFRLRATGTTVRATAAAAATISGEVFGARARVASRIVRIATLFDYLVRNLLVRKWKTLAERNRWKCDQRANRKERGPPHDRTLSAVGSNVASVPPVVPGDSGIVLRPYRSSRNVYRPRCRLSATAHPKAGARSSTFHLTV